MRRVLPTLLISALLASNAVAQAAIPSGLDLANGTPIRVRLAGDRSKAWSTGRVQRSTMDSLFLELNSGAELRFPTNRLTAVEVGRVLTSREGFTDGASRGFKRSLFVDAALLALMAAGPDSFDGKLTFTLIGVSTVGFVGYGAWKGLNEPRTVWGPTQVVAPR